MSQKLQKNYFPIIKYNTTQYSKTKFNFTLIQHITIIAIQYNTKLVHLVTNQKLKIYEKVEE